MKTVDNMTDRELQEMVFRMNVLQKMVGYCYEKMYKSYLLKSKVVPKKSLESSGHVSTKLMGRVHSRVFWKEVVGCGLNGLLQKTII